MLFFSCITSAEANWEQILLTYSIFTLQIYNIFFMLAYFFQSFNLIVGLQAYVLKF